MVSAAVAGERANATAKHAKDTKELKYCVILTFALCSPLLCPPRGERIGAFPLDGGRLDRGDSTPMANVRFSFLVREPKFMEHFVANGPAYAAACPARLARSIYSSAKRTGFLV